MRSLILPEGMASVTVFEQTYGEDGVVVGPDGDGVEDHVAREIMAHDPRIREFTPGSPDDPRENPASQNRSVKAIAAVGAMDRTELFAAGRAMRISMPANLKTEALREIVLNHVATADEKDLPIMIAGHAKDDGKRGIEMLTPEHQAEVNHGNDSLGRAGIHKTGGTGGATFSQEQLAAHAVADRPAPSGQGLLTPMGTSQPPFNQVDSNTGRPSNDSGAAPFPISGHPPIDPETGLPYRDGDPRIPLASRPLMRQGDDILGINDPAAFHAAVDAHEHNAADAIEEATANLDMARAGLKSGPLLNSQEIADRSVAEQAASDQAAKDQDAVIAADPNHGNEAEGLKQKTLDQLPKSKV